MPWNMSNPLYRWKKNHGKLNKSVKTKVYKGKDKMSKKNRSARLRARYRRGRWRSPKKAPLPLLPLIGGVIAPILDSISQSGFINNVQTDPILATKGLIDQISQHYVGISMFPDVSNVRGFNTQYLIRTYTGLIAGIVGHYIANKFGINRAMKRIPLVGKYIAL